MIATLRNSAIWLLLSCAALAQGDECVSPIPIAGVGATPFSTLGMTDSFSPPSCQPTGSSTDCWFAWTPATSDDYIVSICGADYDVVLAAYDACGGSELACDDGFAAGLGTCTGTSNDVVVSLPSLLGGSTYLLQVDGWDGASGTGVLDVQIAPPPPTNDNCSGADLAAIGLNPYTFDGAHPSTPAPSCASVVSADVWFQFTPPTSGAYQLTIPLGSAVGGGDYITVFDDCGGQELGCDYGGTLSSALVNLQLDAATTYKISIESAGDYLGTGAFEIISISPPLEDDCATPLQIGTGSGSFPYDTSFCSPGSEGQAEANCNYLGNMGIDFDAWYVWTASLDGVAIIDTCSLTGTHTNSKLAVYPGSTCPTDGTSLTCDDDTCGLMSQVTFPITTGSEYLVQVGSFQGAGTGSGTLEITEISPSVPGCVGDWSFESFDDSWAYSDVAFPFAPLQVIPDGFRPWAAHFSSEATEGAFSLITGFDGDGPGLISASQDVFVTEGLTPLSFDWRGAYNMALLGNATLDRTFSVVVRDSANVVVQTDLIFTATAGAVVNDTGPITSSVDLSSFIGQPVNIAFEWYLPESFTGPGMFQLDNITCPSGGSIGTNYCTSTPNSTGAAATITAYGSNSISNNDLVLTVNHLPSQPGVFLGGPATTQIPFFNGFLCISGATLQRFNEINFAFMGSVTQAVDLATSANGGLNVVVGQDFHFQRWNRDPQAGGGNANFSDGIKIFYVP